MCHVGRWLTFSSAGLPLLNILYKQNSWLTFRNQALTLDHAISLQRDHGVWEPLMYFKRQDQCVLWKMQTGGCSEKPPLLYFYKYFPIQKSFVRGERGGAWWSLLSSHIPARQPYLSEWKQYFILQSMWDTLKMAFDHTVDFHSAWSILWDSCWKAEVTTESLWKEMNVPVQTAHFYQQMETHIPRNDI